MRAIRDLRSFMTVSRCNAISVQARARASDLSFQRARFQPIAKRGEEAAERAEPEAQAEVAEYRTRLTGNRA
jgi:hypothetical protein